MKQKNRLTPFMLMVVALLIPANIRSQDNSARPKLGLALSGGGSKGLAHIGIMKVIEESGLRPDYITGVSMGSIIGGFYALGYSVDSITKICREVDWNLLLSDRIPEDKIIFLEKKHFYNSLISLPVTPKRITLPSALITGQQVENALNYYLWPAAEINDFSMLPVPFLCVATDMLTGRAVILDKGYLPDAIRASISIPSVFAPVRTDTALLVDGGVVRNYAAGELRTMGADIVIGSYVSVRRLVEEDPESAYNILRQVGFMTSLANYEAQKKETDILIEPDMKPFRNYYYNSYDTLIRVGYYAALPLKGRLIQLADSLDAIGPQPQITPLPEIEYRVFDAIEVTGNELTDTDQIKGVLDIEPGQKVDRDLLRERIELLYGKGWFEKVKYRILTRNDSLILQIACIERPKAMLYGSLHYDFALGAGALVSLSARDIVTKKSVINCETFISRNYRYRLGIMQFIDRSQKFGIEASFFADKTRFPLIEVRGETGPMFSQNIITGLALSQRMSLNHIMSLSFNYKNQHLISDFLPVSRISRISFDYLTLSYSYQANTLNFKHFPDRGFEYALTASAMKLLRITVRANGPAKIYTEENPGDYSFNRCYAARALVRKYFSPSEKVTFDIGGEALFVTDADSASGNNNFFLLGGIDPVTERSVTAIGFHDNQVPVKGLAGIRMGADIEILKDLHLSIAGNIFAIRELGRNEGISLIGGYGAGFGYMSIAGPIRIGLMHGIYSREMLYRPVKVYVNIGFSF